MPVTSQHQAQITQIDFFLHRLLFQYFDANESLKDIGKMSEEVAAIKQFCINGNRSEEEIEDFKAIGDESFFALRSAILYMKTGDDVYIEGFSHQLWNHNIKFDNITTPYELQKYDLERLPKILPNLSLVDPHKKVPFPKFKYEEGRQDSEVDAYGELIHASNPELSLISRSAVIDNHIIDQEVIDAVEEPGKWKFLYHRVNGRESLDPRDSCIKDVWVVLAISPENEVVCLDPNGIEDDINNEHDLRARNNAIAAKDDILKVVNDVFKVAKIPDIQDIKFLDIQASRFKNDSALSCGFAVEDLAKEIFIKNSSFDRHHYKTGTVLGSHSTPISRSQQYLDLLFKQDLIQRFSSVDIDSLKYGERDELNYRKLAYDKEIFDIIDRNAELLGINDDFRNLLFEVKDPDQGISEIKEEYKNGLKLLQTMLYNQLDLINRKIVNHNKQYSQFTIHDVEESSIIAKPENKALNLYNQARYDEARKMMKNQTRGKVNFEYGDLQKSLENYDIRSKKENKIRYSGYYVDEDNNMHLVQKQDRRHFVQPKQKLTEEKIAEKSDAISYNKDLHSFSAVEDGENGLKSIEFNEEKYKADTTIYYYLGDMTSEKLIILEEKFSKKMHQKDIAAHLKTANNIKLLNEQYKIYDDEEIQKQIEEKIGEHRKDLGEDSRLTDEDVRNFLRFRQHQGQSKSSEIEESLEKGLKECIKNSENQRKQMPKTVAMNATVGALVDIQKGKGENYSNIQPSGGGFARA